MSKIQSTKDKLHENVIIAILQEHGWEYVSREKSENNVLGDTLVFYNYNMEGYNKISANISVSDLVNFIKCEFYEFGVEAGKLQKAFEIGDHIGEIKKALYINEDL